METRRVYMGVVEQKIQDKSQKINEKHEQIQEAAKKGLDKIVDKIESQSEMARCNKVGIVCHTIVSAAIGIAYLAEFAKGSRTICIAYYCNRNCCTGSGVDCI